MTEQYRIITLSAEERDRLQCAYNDLRSLAACEVPAVSSAARAALAQIAQALNGQGIAFELYSQALDDPPTPY